MDREGGTFIEVILVLLAVSSTSCCGVELVSETTEHACSALLVGSLLVLVLALALFSLGLGLALLLVVAAGELVKKIHIGSCV